MNTETEEYVPFYGTNQSDDKVRKAINDKYIRQRFIDKFDCYADSDKVIPAMTVDDVVQLVTDLLTKIK